MQINNVESSRRFESVLLSKLSIDPAINLVIAFDGDEHYMSPAMLKYADYCTFNSTGFDVNIPPNLCINQPIIVICGHGQHMDHNVNTMSQDIAINMQLNLATNSSANIIFMPTDLTDKDFEPSRQQRCQMKGFGYIVVNQRAGSHCSLTTTTIGNINSTISAEFNLLEATASCTFNGVQLPTATAEHALTLQVNHLHPNCSSHSRLRGIVDEQANASFIGNITVHPYACQTAASLEHKYLLLSPQAKACAAPQLEIYNDDVKCSHGSSFGHLDQTALFYMHSRGIPLDIAKQLLIAGFLTPAIRAIPSTAVYTCINKLANIAIPEHAFEAIYE